MKPAGGESGAQLFLAEWGIPILGGVLVFGLLSLLPPGTAGTITAPALGLTILLLLGLWIASGASVISIAMWFVPAVLLSAAWYLRPGPVTNWAVLVVPLGVAAITFFPSANRWWGALITKAGGLLLRVGQDATDRAVDAASESVRERVVVALTSGVGQPVDRLLADLAGIRRAAEDLPTEDVRTAQLRRALLRFVDSIIGAVNQGELTTPETEGAIAAYRLALGDFRRNSLLYRVASARRKPRSASRD